MEAEDDAKTEKSLAEEFLETGDKWLNAAEALVASIPPDGKPLV